jgi:hypothetical protein
MTENAICQYYRVIKVNGDEEGTRFQQDRRVRDTIV